MTKRFAAITLAFGLLLGTQAKADIIDNAFSSLTGGSTTTSSAGVFESKTRYAFSGGGIDMRFPQKTVQLVSITPPSFSAGCGGVSAHFGGFSFINGEQIQQLLQNIAQGAMGYVFQIAITELCPLCGSILGQIQEWAAKAAALSINSCEWSKKLAEGITSPFVSKNESYCQKYSQDSGESDDMIAGRTACDDPSKTKAKIDEAKATKTPGELCNDPATGNTTWCVLTKMGFTSPDDTDPEKNITAMIMMSMIGTISGDTTDTTAQEQPRTIEPKDALEALVCGTGAHNPATEPVIYNFCQKANVSDLFIYSCGTDYEKCNPVERKKLSFYNQISSGFARLVKQELTNAVNEVAKPSGGALSPAAKELIAAAPFPLYQLINLGATYPDLAEQVISDNSMAIAHMLAVNYLKKVFTEARKAGPGLLPGGSPDIAPQLMSQIFAHQNLIDTGITASAHYIDELANRQTIIMSVVKSANKEMMRGIHTMGLSGVEFARGVAR